VTLELLALAALLFSDPSGDAHGAGDLAPPSAPLYASRGPFDLVEVRVEDAAQLTIEVRLAGIPDPGGLPNGLTLPVIDLYLDTADGGREALLPGPDMRMPAGRGWELALRVHGDDAYLRRAAQPDGPALPVEVRRQGDRLRLRTGLPRPDEVRDVQALTGVYDPFGRDAWRPLASAPSPWAFASEVPAPPVIDLLAADDAAQRDALRSFVLPDRRSGPGALPWLALMALGLAVAVAGLLLRRRVPAGDVTGDAAGEASGEAASARDAAPGRRRSPGAAPYGTPPGRTLPTRLAGRDGWWSEEAPEPVDDAAAGGTTPSATHEGGAGDGAAPRTWPAPSDRPPPLWSRASGPDERDAAFSDPDGCGSDAGEAESDDPPERRGAREGSDASEPPAAGDPPAADEAEEPSPDDPSPEEAPPDEIARRQP
jgi:hypothetical protein